MPSELGPMVVVGMCDVPDGKMPAAATAIVRRAIEGGMWVRSTYAVVFVPNVLRKVVGFLRGEGGEGDAAKGGSMARVTVTRETVAVRVRVTEGRWPQAYAIWLSDDGSAWKFDNAQVWHGPHEWPRRVSATGLYV